MSTMNLESGETVKEPERHCDICGSVMVLFEQYIICSKRLSIAKDKGMTWALRYRLRDECKEE